jgi:hypothetical protein
MACGQVCQRTGSMQLRVLRLRFLQDGEVGVGVFRRRENPHSCQDMLRKLQLQRINLPVAHVAHDDRRVVRSRAIPGLAGK